MLPWTILEEQFPVRNVAASIIGNGIMWLLWQLRCYCNPDHNTFSSLSNTTMVAIFPNVCLWCRNLCSKKKLHRYWPWKTVSSHFHVLVRPMLLHRMALVSVRRFCKHLGNLQEFFGQTVYPPPPDKKLPVRLCKDGKGRQFDSRKKSHCMASRSRKINQMQCTFLQNKYVTEVGPWKVAPCTDTMNKEE